MIVVVKPLVAAREQIMYSYASIVRLFFSSAADFTINIYIRPMRSVDVCYQQLVERRSGLAREPGFDEYNRFAP